MDITYQPPRDCEPITNRGCLYASIPYFKGEWTITGNDGNPWSLRGYGELPECFKALPVIRFDLSSNEATRLYMEGVMETIPSEHANLARGCGLVVEEPQCIHYDKLVGGDWSTRDQDFITKRFKEGPIPCSP